MRGLGLEGRFSFHPFHLVYPSEIPLSVCADTEMNAYGRTTNGIHCHYHHLNHDDAGHILTYWYWRWMLANPLPDQPCLALLRAD